MWDLNPYFQGFLVVKTPIKGFLESTDHPTDQFSVFNVEIIRS